MATYIIGATSIKITKKKKSGFIFGGVCLKDDTSFCSTFKKKLEVPLASLFMVYKQYVSKAHSCNSCLSIRWAVSFVCCNL